MKTLYTRDIISAPALILVTQTRSLVFHYFIPFDLYLIIDLIDPNIKHRLTKLSEIGSHNLLTERCYYMACSCFC